MGGFDGVRIKPRNATQRKTSLFICIIRFCLIWKSQGISFNTAIEKLKLNFKAIDFIISGKHVKDYVKYEYDAKKVEPPITTIIVYDLETFNSIKFVPHANCIYKLSKLLVNTKAVYQKKKIKNV